MTSPSVLLHASAVLVVTLCCVGCGDSEGVASADATTADAASTEATAAGATEAVPFGWRGRANFIVGLRATSTFDKTPLATVIEELREEVAKNPSDMSKAWFLALAQEEDGQYQEMLLTLRRLESLEDKWIEVKAARGRALVAVGLQENITLLRQFETTGQFDSALSNSSVSQTSSGLDLLEEWQRQVEGRTEDQKPLIELIARGDSLFLMGLAYQRFQRDDVAADVFERAAELGHEQARQALAMAGGI